MMRRPGTNSTASAPANHHPPLSASSGIDHGKESTAAVGGGGGGDGGGSSNTTAGASLRGSLSKLKGRTAAKKPTTTTNKPPLSLPAADRSKRRPRARGATAGLLLLLFGGLGPLVVKRVLEGWHYHPRHHPHGPNDPAPAETTTSRMNKPGGRSSGNVQERQHTTVESVRLQYHQRYGGPELAQAMYKRGIQEFGSIDATAERMLRSAASHTDFVLSFAGYSVTVGRGNHYRQSFPFVVERILQPLLHDALGVNVVVRNAAIGGIPSFPYGFCFEHFLGIDSDVVSWDYSMNEGGGAAVLESYVRHAQSQLSNTRPMVIVLDTNPQRCQLLKSYADLGVVKDALCVGKAKDAVVDLEARTRKQGGGDAANIPEGFRNWDEFGAPPSCPGRGSWHPKKQEHALIGWNIAMYFVSAVERALDLAKSRPDGVLGHGGGGGTAPSNATTLVLPKPLSAVLPANDEAVTSLLYGHAVKGTNPGDSAARQFRMHRVSCRTNFLPAMDQEKILPSVVVSGLADGVSSRNILEERSDAHYRSGWVLDVSKVERDTKIKVDACGGLGYVDMKIALYGIPESGKLRLWLPVAAKAVGAPESTVASDYVNELVICEANEKRPEKACHLDHDLRYTVGGVKVESTTMIQGAAEYLKRSTCVHVGVPAQATVTSLDRVKDTSGQTLSVDVKRRLQGGQPSNGGSPKMGLVVDIEVTGSVTRKDGACCISHIIWEHSTP